MVVAKKKEVKKKPKKQHNWWKYLLCVVGGFVLCIGSIVGGVAIAGTVLSTAQVITLFGGDPGEILTEDYQNKTILQFVMSFTSGEIKIDSLGGIAQITPYVDTLIDGLNETFQTNLGFTFDQEELYAVSFNDIGNYLFDTIKSKTALANLVDVDESSENLLKYLLLPKNEDGTYDFDHPYSLADYLKDDFLNNLFKNITLGDFVDCSKSSMLQALSDKTLEDLSKDETIKNLKIKDIYGDSEASGIINALIDKDTTIGGLEDAINDLTIGDFVTVNDDSSQILKTLKDKRVGDLSSTINTLTLEQCVAISDSSPQILKTLCDTPINNLSSRIDTLKLGECLNNDQLNQSEILSALSDSYINNLGNEINNIKIVTAFESKIFTKDADGNITGYTNAAWKYLLTPSTEDEFETAEQLKENSAYTISEMDQLMNNMQHHVQRLSIKELREDGYLNISDDIYDNKLSKQMGVDDEGNPIHYYDLTIAGFIELLSGFII